MSRLNPDHNGRPYTITQQGWVRHRTSTREGAIRYASLLARMNNAPCEIHGPTVNGPAELATVNAEGQLDS